MTVTIEPGNTLLYDNERFMVISVFYNGPIIMLSLIRLDTEKRQIIVKTYDEIKEASLRKELQVINLVPVIAHNLSLEHREKLDHRMAAMRRLDDLFGPDYLRLNSDRRPKELSEVKSMLHVSLPTFQKMITAYLQSGRAESSLVDHRYKGFSTPASGYHYTRRPGRKPTVGALVASDVIIDSTVESYFAEALDYYRDIHRTKNVARRNVTLQDCFDEFIIRAHYSEERIENGKVVVYEADCSEKPTIRQFYYYCHTHLSIQEKGEIETSKMEWRNNRRMLQGSSMRNAYHPGMTEEWDGWEFDGVALSRLREGQIVGRPVLYMRIDVATSVITGFSVSFHNDSKIALANLMRSMCDDPAEICRRYGVALDSPDYWPAHVIPESVRFDRGPDFASDFAGEVLSSLNTVRFLEPPGTGSMKPKIERSFGQFKDSIKRSLENHGLITKRHDSNARATAVMTIDDYAKLALEFIIYHNRSVISGYKRSEDMIRNAIPAVPYELWKHKCGQYGTPRTVTNVNDFLIRLMQKESARVSREGVSWNGLWFRISTDISPELINLAYTEKSPRISIYVDPRCLGNVFYVNSRHQLIALPMNTDKMQSWDEKLRYISLEDWKILKDMDSEQQAVMGEYNARLRRDYKRKTEAIVETAKAINGIATSSDGIAEARHEDRGLENYSTALIHSMDKTALLGYEPDPETPGALSEPAVSSQIPDQTSQTSTPITITKEGYFKQRRSRK